MAHHAVHPLLGDDDLYSFLLSIALHGSACADRINVQLYKKYIVTNRICTQYNNIIASFNCQLLQ